MSKKEEMYSSWQGDSELQSEKVNNMLEIEQIGINELKGFKNHPFKVETNRELFELMQSIERDGILVGALLLAGLYALFGNVVMPTLTKRITDMFNYAG
jgi:ParB family chromosome partitioning protein